MSVCVCVATGSRASNYPSLMIRSNYLRGLIPMNFALILTAVNHNSSPVSIAGLDLHPAYQRLESICTEFLPVLLQVCLQRLQNRVTLAFRGSRGPLERLINVISVPDQGGKGLFSCPDAAPTCAVLQPQPVGC